MTNCIPTLLDCNQKTPFFGDDSEGFFYLQAGTSVRVEQNSLNAWYIRSQFLKEPPEASEKFCEWFTSAYPEATRNIPGLLTTPRDYQYVGFDFLEMQEGNSPRNGAGWLDMGLGKSLITIMQSLHCYHTTGKNLTFIVCPLSVFYTWQEQVAEHIKPEVGAEVVFAHGREKTKVCQELSFRKKPTFVVTTYDTFNTITDRILNLTNVALVAFDEAQCLKNYETKRTQHAHAFIKKFKGRVVLLSGTPSTKSPEGFFSLYELLGTGRSGCSTLLQFKNKYIDSMMFVAFKNPYKTNPNSPNYDPNALLHLPLSEKDNWLKTRKPTGGLKTFFDLGYRFTRDYPRNEKELKIERMYPKVLGTKNIPELTLITAQNAFVLKKDDVMSLPEKIPVTRVIKMSAEQRKAYNEMLEESATEIGKERFSFKNLNSPHCKLHQIANGYLKKKDFVTEFKDQPKLEALMEIFEENENEKIIVCSPFVWQIKQIMERFKKEKIDFALNFGELNRDQRIQNCDKFIKDVNCRAMIGNPATMGMGLNLTCSAIMVFMANWYRPDVRKQTVDRIYRSGQKRVTTIVDLIMEGTIEPKIYEMFMREIELENQILKLSKVA